MIVRRVKSEDNLADIGTKTLSNKIIRKHATSMEYVDVQEYLRSRDVVGVQTAAATVAVATVAKSLRVGGTVVTELRP